MSLAPGFFRSTRSGLFVILLTGLPTLGAAQPAPDSTRGDTTRIRDRLAPILDTFDATERLSAQLAERYAALADDPFDLNEASVSDLASIPTLSVGQARRIVRYRDEQGPFKRIAGLRSVKGITPTRFRALRPFVTVDSSTTTGTAARSVPSFDTITSNLEFALVQRATRRLDLGRGYRENRFLGPPGRLTTRARLHYQRHVQLALTLDKDPGEPLRWAPSTDTYGFDHVVGSLALRDLGPLDTFVAGNFTAQFGQGVALWQGFRLGKGRDPVSPVLRSGRGLLPYRSASEGGYFRGVGATVELLGSFFVTAFGSRRHRDATLDSSLVEHGDSGEPIPARTIASGGRHRTPSELARKGTFGEHTVGGALEYRSSSLHLGITGYRSHFGRPLRPGDKPYRRFRVSGRHTSMTSAYGTAHVDEYILFGEVARAANGAYGGLVGAALDPGEVLQAVVLGRSYPPRLSNFYGNAFGESGGAQNEQGVYTGLRVRITENWRIGAYVDLFRSPWLQFNTPAPSSGWEGRTVLEYEPRPWLSTYIQARAQTEEAGTEHPGPFGRTLDGLHEEKRYSVRWHGEYAYSDALTFRSRVEWTHYSSPETTANGFFLSQGVRFTPLPTLDVDAKIAFFDTDGFAARIYAYERDLLYSFSVPVFFDRGRRSYVLIQYEPTGTLTLEAKYGVTRYANRNTIGSGLNQIQGSRRRELRFQIRWSF